MTVSIGAYELSLRERAVEARRRMARQGAAPVSTPRLNIRSIIVVPPEPVIEPTPRREVTPVRALEMPGSNPFEWRHIVHEICLKHNVTFGEITGHRRTRRIATARHEAFYRLSKDTTMSLPQIGRYFSGKDHSTVAYGIRKHEASCKALGEFPPLSTLPTG